MWETKVTGGSVDSKKGFRYIRPPLSILVLLVKTINMWVIRSTPIEIASTIDNRLAIAVCCPSRTLL